jgi:site-specific recombinase XerD
MVYIKTLGVSPRYANDIIKTLRTSFRVLVADGLVNENPFEKVKNIKHPQKLINVLTPQELKTLLNAPDQRRYAEFRDYVARIVMILITVSHPRNKLPVYKFLAHFIFENIDRVGFTGILAQ